MQITSKRETRKGESHPKARFSDHEVEVIRELVEFQLCTREEVMAKFEISKSYLSELLQYKYR